MPDIIRLFNITRKRNKTGMDIPLRDFRGRNPPPEKNKADVTRGRNQPPEKNKADVTRGRNQTPEKRRVPSSLKLRATRERR